MQVQVPWSRKRRSLGLSLSPSLRQGLGQGLGLKRATPGGAPGGALGVRQPPMKARANGSLSTTAATAVIRRAAARYVTENNILTLKFTHHLLWALWETKYASPKIIQLHVMCLDAVRRNKLPRFITATIKCVLTRWALL